MKSQRIRWWVASSAVVLIGVGLQLSSAQERLSVPFTPPAERVIVEERRIAVPTPGTAVDPTPGLSWHGLGSDAKSAIRKAAEELRDAEGDEARDKAEANLRDLLSKYFHEDLKQRFAQMQEMQERLRKLQEQLARRREKMQEIIDLQIKVLINEADGLGFFSNAPAPNGLPSATQKPYYFYSPRTTEEGRATIQPAPNLPTPTPAEPLIDPTPAPAQPSPPREPAVAPAVTK